MRIISSFALVLAHYFVKMGVVFKSFFNGKEVRMNVNIVLLNKNGTTKPFALPSTVTTIGRRQECDFCLPLGVVSRRHCEIYIESRRVSVRDFGSRNGTYLNGQKIDESRLKAGDLLQIGPIRFVLQIDGQPDTFDTYLTEPDETSDKTAGTFDSPPDANASMSETTDLTDSDHGIGAENKISRKS